jgi:hypothetical protein
MTLLRENVSEDEFRWAGASTDGQEVSSGVYFAVIRDGNRSSTRKVVLVR